MPPRQRLPAWRWRRPIGNNGERVYFFFYYPLGVEREPEGRPWASWALIAVMTAVFLWFRLHPLAALLHWEWWVFFPQEPLRPGLVLSVFNHAGWLHLAGNLFYLWTFAPSLERALGGWRFLLHFLFLGVASNLCQGIAGNLWQGHLAGFGVVGASGALSGLLGLFLLRFPHARIRTAWVVFSPLYGQLRSGVAAIPTAVAIGAWVLLQLAQVGATALGSRDATAYGAHFGGLLMGILLGLGLHLPQEGWAFSVRHRAERRMAAGDWMGAYEAIHPLIDPDGKGGRREPEDYCLAARACRLLALYSESRTLYRRGVAASLALKDEAGAAAVYAEALRVFPDLAFPEAQLYRLALALDRLGERRAALRALELFHRLYSGSARLPVVLLRAARLEEIEDPDRARELYGEQLARFPDSPYGSLARKALLGLGRT